MRKTDFLQFISGWAVFLALCLPMAAHAADFNFNSQTILRGFERDTASGSDSKVVPIYEYLQADFGADDEPGLSFHTSGWGRLDLADSDYYLDSSAGELLYGYLEFTRQQAHFNARLGRQHVFEGVANESIDGLRLSSDLGRYFSGSIYAGQPVALANDNGRGGDSIYGGRLANRLPGLYDLGLSYKKIKSDSNDAEEMTGIDLAAYLPYNIDLYGFSTYNLNTDDWAEHSWELRLPVGPAALRPYFQKFRYADYFGTGDNSANPFRILADSDEVLSILGADLTMSQGESWTLVGKFKQYDYDLLNDTAYYYSAQATWNDDEDNQVGGEIGSMHGDNAQNRYYLARIFTYWQELPTSLPFEFVSADLVYVDYDQKINGEDSSLFLSLGIGHKYLEDALEVKLSADYSRDPYFDNDLRTMLTFNYSFASDAE